MQTYDQSWCVAITFFPLQFPRQFPGRLQAGPRVNARRTGGTGRLSQGLGDERSAARELSVRAAGARYSRAEVAGCAWYRQGAPDFVLCISLVLCLSKKRVHGVCIGRVAQCGGGYRYDGLFKVAAADLVRGAKSGLLTALFTLERTN